MIIKVNAHIKNNVNDDTSQNMYNIMSMKFERYNIYNESRQYFKNKSHAMSIM